MMNQMTGRLNKTSICSVVFLDIIDHSKKPVHDQIEDKTRFNTLITEAIKNVALNDRILIDTGDGAAIAFMGEPEEALFTALIMRDVIIERNKRAESQMAVRIGINLGSVRVVKDINNRLNIIGDGINVAERIMSFAGKNQILVSRSFYEVTARLTQEITNMFLYSGVKQDKHVREHEVYTIVAKIGIPENDSEAASIVAVGGTESEAHLHNHAAASNSTFTLTRPSVNFSAIQQTVAARVQQLTNFLQVLGQTNFANQLKTSTKLLSAWRVRLNRQAVAYRIAPIYLIGLLVGVLLIAALIWISFYNAKDSSALAPDDGVIQSEKVYSKITSPNSALILVNQAENTDALESRRQTLSADETKLNASEQSTALNQQDNKKVLSNPTTNLPEKRISKKNQTPKPAVQAATNKELMDKHEVTALSAIPTIVTKTEVIKASPVENKINCSQAQIAMQQCK